MWLMGPELDRKKPILGEGLVCASERRRTTYRAHLLLTLTVTSQSTYFLRQNSTVLPRDLCTNREKSTPTLNPKP